MCDCAEERDRKRALAEQAARDARNRRPPTPAEYWGPIIGKSAAALGLFGLLWWWFDMGNVIRCKILSICAYVMNTLCCRKKPACPPPPKCPKKPSITISVKTDDKEKNCN